MGLGLMILTVLLACVAVGVAAYCTILELSDAWEVSHNHRRPAPHHLRLPRLHRM